MARPTVETADGIRSSYDPEYPWGRLFEFAVQDRDRWQDALMELCLLINARARTVDTYV